MKSNKNIKIGIVTFHRACNIGAVLQSYSLYKCIGNMETDVEIIDYMPENFNFLYYDKISPNFGNTGVSSRIKHIIMYPRLKKKNKAFEKFVKSNIKLSKHYDTNNIKTINSENYDIIFAGSDQIWNDSCAEFDSVYFLSFDSQTDFIKASYAASFGFNSIPEHLKQEYIKRLTGINYYSVREISGRKIIMNLLGIEAKVCCDPTLLNTKDEWKRLASKVKIRLNKNYIFVYYVNRSEELLEYAKTLGKKTKCKVICVPGEVNFSTIIGIKNYKYGFCQDITCSPEKFLNYIMNCKYLITNSFHGTIFGVLFHRQFQVTLKSLRGRYDYRVGDFLKMVNLESRCIENGFDHIDDNIPWKHVETKIQDMRSKSIEYISNVIMSAKV